MSDRRPRIRIFVGPTASAQDMRDACAAMDADVHIAPPIQQGDLLRLGDNMADVVAIIDGYFLGVPAVTHKEILITLERGVSVLGAASMGALRAAELDVFGMQGVGEIYDLYRRGRIDGDDEVAVLHGPEEDGFQPLTIALVNLRHNLRRARAKHVISASTEATVIRHAKRLGFAERTLDRILASGVLADQLKELAALRDFLGRDSVDLKRTDALGLARALADCIRLGHTRPTGARMPVNYTKYLERYKRTYVGRVVRGHDIPDTLVVAFQRLLRPGFPRLYRQVARRCLAVDEALERGIQPSDPQELVAAFGTARSLRTAESWRDWLKARCMSRAELLAWLRERDLERMLLDEYRASCGQLHERMLHRAIARDVATRTGVQARDLLRPLLMRPGIPWEAPLIRELKVRGRFGSALAMAADVMEHNAQFARANPWFSRSLITRSRLDAWFARRWHIDVSALGLAILDRGFGSYEEFSEPARYIYLYGRRAEATPAS